MIILSMLLEGSLLENTNIPQFNIQNFHEFKDIFKIKRGRRTEKKKRKEKVKKKYTTSSRTHIQNVYQENYKYSLKMVPIYIYYSKTPNLGGVDFQGFFLADILIISDDPFSHSHSSYFMFYQIPVL